MKGRHKAVDIFWGGSKLLSATMTRNATIIGISIIITGITGGDLARVRF